MKLDEVVRQFLLDCEVRGLTDQAIGFYRKRLTLFVRKLEEECQITELEEVKIVHLRQFVQLLMKTKADENNPRKPAQDKPLPAFTTEHVEKMLATCDRSTVEGFRNYVILLVFLDTGMRISELCGLRVSD